MILAVGPVLFLLVFLWQRREEIASGWQLRWIFPPSMCWGMAAMYALSGFIPMFSTFGAPHLGIRPDSAFMQALTAFSLVSVVVIHLAARRLAKPRFAAHDIPAKKRNEFHEIWMGFWLVGFVLGWLPMFLG